MKTTVLVIFIWTAIILYFFNQKDTISTPHQTVQEQINPLSKQKKLDFIGQRITFDDIPVVTYTSLASDVTTIDSFMKAILDEEVEILELDFFMEEEPISNGMFVFRIETEEDKNLTIEFFDEEGRSTGAIYPFDIRPGYNFKAFDLSNLESGEYRIVIKDENDKELYRTLNLHNE